MYNMLVHAHSGLRYVVLALLIAAVIDGFRRSGPSDSAKNRLALFGLIFTHIQLLLGLALYFISPKVQFVAGVMKDSVLRFYTVEHISVMLIAIALITIGYSQGKKLLPAAAGYRRTAVYYLIGLILIIVSIPWPFRGLGAGWF